MFCAGQKLVQFVWPEIACVPVSALLPSRLGTFARLTVTLPPSWTAPPPARPSPAVTVTEALANLPLSTQPEQAADSPSAATALNEQGAAPMCCRGSSV